MVLTIGFRGSIESANIQRIGVNAGKIVTRGFVTLLGQKVDREILFYQNKDKAILYNGAAEVSNSHLALTANLDDFGRDYAGVALPVSLQTTADQILAPLSSVPPSTSWTMYTNSMFQVSLQFPSNWSLDTSGDAVYSGPDGFFQLTASESLGLSAVAFCQETLHNIETLDQTNLAKADMFGYGRHPMVETLLIDQQPACFILPSGDQPDGDRGGASLFVDYPKPMRPAALLTLYADRYHIHELAARLKFIAAP